MGSIVVHLIIAAVLAAYPSQRDAAIQFVVLTLAIAPLVAYTLYWQASRYIRRSRQHEHKAGAGPRRASLSAALLPSDAVELS